MSRDVFNPDLAFTTLPYDVFNPDIAFATLLYGEYYHYHIPHECIIQSSIMFPQYVKENNILMITSTYGLYRGDRLQVAIKQKNFKAFQTFHEACDKINESHLFYAVNCHNKEALYYIWKHYNLNSYNNSGYLLLETLKQITELYQEVKNQINGIIRQIHEERLEFKRLKKTWTTKTGMVFPIYINVYNEIYEKKNLENVFGWWYDNKYDMKYFMRYICPKNLKKSTAEIITNLLQIEPSKELLFSQTNAYFFKIIECLPDLYDKSGNLHTDIARFKEASKPTSTLNVKNVSLYDQQSR